jgi:molybdenum cofactor cytidylyltransferase
VLAAGLAQRFGGRKLLATLGGRPLVSHVLETVSAARASGLLAGVVVVAEEGNDPVSDMAKRSGAALAWNRDPSRGLSSSLALGLSALPDQLDAALVFLGDQPLVRMDVIRSLIDAWRNGEDEALIRPRYARAPDTPGHPVLLPRPFWALARGLEGDRGLGSRLATETVHIVDVAGDNPDVNTPADLASLEERYR